MHHFHWVIDQPSLQLGWVYIIYHCTTHYVLLSDITEVQRLDRAEKEIEVCDEKLQELLHTTATTMDIGKLIQINIIQVLYTSFVQY